MPVDPSFDKLTLRLCTLSAGPVAVGDAQGQYREALAQHAEDEDQGLSSVRQHNDLSACTDRARKALPRSWAFRWTTASVPV